MIQSPGRLAHDTSFYHLGAPGIAGKACQGLACFVARGGDPDRWLQASSQQSRVYCLGKCYAAPAHASDSGRPAAAIHARRGIVLARVATGGARTLAAYRDRGGYQALRAALDRSPEATVSEIERSELRGRGGAGFPSGRKWQAVFAERAERKYVIANADEGDAGAYIDRFLMEDDPFALLEALAIAGYAVGASHGYVYVRIEYPAAVARLRDAVDAAREEGLLGPSVLGSAFAFDVEIVVGQGSYVCGEETALLNSIEGRRPEVRTRPPYPTTAGLWGKPTLVHNVETLVNVPWIVRHGGAAYREIGTGTSRGTKVVSLNSLFTHPGLYEIDFGTPVRTIVEEYGGGLRTGDLKGVVIGGPLAGILPPSLLDTPFAFDELRAVGAAVGHGGIIAFDQRTSIVDLLHHVFSFGAYESCGKCTPCRLGSRRIEILAERMREGVVPPPTQAEVVALLQALAETSLCGHGTGMAEFGRSVLNHYGEELAACLA